MDNINFKNIYQKIFSNSKFGNFLEIKQFEELILFHKKIDKLIEKKFQEITTFDQKGLEENTVNELNLLSNKLNSKESNNPLFIKVESSSSLYDVYNRQIPVNYGISIKNEKNKNKIYKNYSIYMYKWSNPFLGGGT